MLKYLLLARTGSGRKYFQKLAAEQGYFIARSYTDRPPVDENDDSHIFVNDIANVKSYCQRVLETTHDGYTYFYDKTDLAIADIIPIDPEHVHELCDMFPNDAFRIVEIMAENKDRLAHAVADKKDKLTAENDFIAKCEEENAAFSEFEDKLTSGGLNIRNCYTGQIINNDFTDDSRMHDFINSLPAYFREFERALTIVLEMKNADKFNIVNYKNGGDIIRVPVRYDNNENIKFRDFTPSDLAERMLIDPDAMHHIVGEWLRMENTCFGALIDKVDGNAVLEKGDGV